MNSKRKKDFILKIDINNVIVHYDKASLLPNKRLKHSALQRPLQPFTLREEKIAKEKNVEEKKPELKNANIGQTRIL